MRHTGRQVGGARGAAPAWWRVLEWPLWEIALEPVARSHTARVRRALTNEIAQWLGIGSVEDMRAGTAVWAAESATLAETREAYRYVISRSGRFAGVIEVRPDALRGHIGYWLRRGERGRGTATLANRLVLAIAFDGIGLRAVDWTADAANGRSIAVMVRLGGRLMAEYESTIAGRHREVRYRVERRRYRPDATGPRHLGDLIRESDNVSSSSQTPEIER